jgi:xylan 1,4-beta-xylosidase
MKYALPTLAALLLATASHAQDAPSGPTYQNPVIATTLADPTVLLHDGTYYLYATGDANGDNGTRVYTSGNLVDWKRGPVVFQPGQPHVWAPDVWRDPDSGRFYLYYTVNKTIGVAQADSPLGPFKIVRKFVDQAIDAHLFRDDDGKLYLYYVQLPGFRITVQQMAGPTELAGQPRLVLTPESDWERKAGHVTEGPWIIKRQDRYYLLYSGSGANTPDYAVGYATADDPLGPFTRAEHNPIIHRSAGRPQDTSPDSASETEGRRKARPGRPTNHLSPDTKNVYGPGHGCAIQDAEGQWWHVYHQKRSPRIAWDRDICIDPLQFDEKGRLQGRATRATPHAAPTAR